MITRNRLLILKESDLKFVICLCLRDEFLLAAVHTAAAAAQRAKWLPPAPILPAYDHGDLVVEEDVDAQADELHNFT
jgi:hypothetical protein